MALLLLLAVRLPAFAAEPLEARALYVNKCARCHRLYEPSQYGPEEWGRWLGKMRRKARLTDEQAAAITSLATNAPTKLK